MDIEPIVAYQNLREGRVIPRARYWGAYWLIGVAYLWGALVVVQEIPWWLSIPGITAVYYAYTVLLDKYKQRSIK